MKSSLIYWFIGSVIILFIANGCGEEKSDNKRNHSDDSEVEYQNKPFYDVKIDDTIMIYYSLNSCCSFCSPNLKKLKHITFIKDTLIRKEKKEFCAGCDNTSALMFVAKSAGKDTILEQILKPLTPCSDTLSGFNLHIVRVR